VPPFRYGQGFPTKQLFWATFDKYTKDHMALVYNGTDSMERRLNKRYYWYRAQEPPEFRMGNTGYWDDDDEDAQAGAEQMPGLDYGYSNAMTAMSTVPL